MTSQHLKPYLVRSSVSFPRREEMIEFVHERFCDQYGSKLGAVSLRSDLACDCQSITPGPFSFNIESRESNSATARQSLVFVLVPSRLIHVLFQGFKHVSRTLYALHALNMTILNRVYGGARGMFNPPTSPHTAPSVLRL